MSDRDRDRRQEIAAECWTCPFGRALGIQSEYGDLPRHELVFLNGMEYQQAKRDRLGERSVTVPGEIGGVRLDVGSMRYDLSSCKP
jgi:hypothetical protein